MNGREFKISIELHGETREALAHWMPNSTEPHNPYLVASTLSSMSLMVTNVVNINNETQVGRRLYHPGALESEHVPPARAYMTPEGRERALIELDTFLDQQGSQLGRLGAYKPPPPPEMTWSEFATFLKQNGFTYTPGDYHFAGRGHWYPIPPELDGSESPLPPEPWIHVDNFSHRQEVFIGTSFPVGDSKSTFAESPQAAKAAIERALMAFDSAPGFSGYDDDGVSSSCDQGNHERCSNCECGCHVGAAIKTCTRCDRTFSRSQWDELPLLGKQEIEADGDDPAAVFIAKNCPCGGTMYLEEEIGA